MLSIRRARVRWRKAAATLALLLVAAPRLARAAPAPADTFAYDIVGDVNTLDPHWQYDSVSHTVARQAYETLIFYRGTSVKDLDPLIASVVPARENGLVTADGLRYTFPIRKGVRFHDGSLLTPADVKYSFLRFLLMDRAGGGSGLLLEPILGLQSTRDGQGRLRNGVFAAADGAVRVEGQAVVIELEKPFAPFLQIVAAFCPVVSKSWVVAHGGWDGTAATLDRINNIPKESSPLHEHINGTGPFTLESWDQKDKRLVLARFDKYWQGPARLKRLVFKTVDDPAARPERMASGEADATMLERRFLPQIESLPGVTVEDELPLFEVHDAFVFNQRIDPAGNPDIGSGRLDGEGIPPDFFADADLRRAFAHAFDYESYIREGYRGKAQKARGPIPAGVSGYDESMNVPAFNPARASELFQSAWKGKVWLQGFKFAATYEQGRTDRQLACQILKRNVETLNPKFKIECRAVLFSTWLSRFVQGKYPLVNTRWVLDYPDPHNAVQPFLDSQGYFAKATGYSNVRADRLIREAATELEPDHRNALYREIQALAAIDLPAFFTVDTYAVRVYRSNVRDWAYNPMLDYGYFYPVHKEGP
ncbi:MAG: ABC transporter substrate-binding protein [Elusimicrobia bacterium]|nr:ABC transporter substrate-binding protein [Elusimicrobiota bacterium]